MRIAQLWAAAKGVPAAAHAPFPNHRSAVCRDFASSFRNPETAVGMPAVYRLCQRELFWRGRERCLGLSCCADSCMEGVLRVHSRAAVSCSALALFEPSVSEERAGCEEEGG